jgi:hypothetical protein
MTNNETLAIKLISIGEILSLCNKSQLARFE